MLMRSAVLLALALAFTWEGYTLFVQDVALRPVFLQAFRGEPLPLDGAIERLGRATEVRGDRADAQLRLAEHLERRSHADEAGEGGLEEVDRLLTSAARRSPTWAPTQYHLGRKLLRDGDLDAARERLEHAVALAGNHPALIERVGDVGLDLWGRAGDPEALLDAVAYYRRASERDPKRLDGCLARLGEVLPEPLDLVHATPDDADSQTVLAMHLLERGREEKAFAILEAAEGSAADPETEGMTPQRRRLRALALLRTGRQEQALEAYAAAVRQARDREWMVPRVERDLRVLDPAIRVRFFAALDDVGPRARVAHARALVAAGQPAVAMARVDEILAGYADLSVPVRGITDVDVQLRCYELRIADYERRKLLVQAAGEAEAAARLDPGPHRWRIVGRLLARTGNVEGTRRAYERAFEAAHGMPESEKHLASLGEELERSLRTAGRVKR